MEKYLEKLEYNKILEKLSSFAVTYLGKEKCNSLKPESKEDTVKDKLKETEEGLNLIYRCNIPPIHEIADNDKNIKIIESYGTLSIKGILELNSILKISADLKKYFSAEYIDKSEYKILAEIFVKLYTNPTITEKIEKSIIDENTIDDRASKELASIRKKQRNCEQEIKEKLNAFIHTSTYSKYIQENVITIRNDRYVIPVKDEYRNQIKGFVHDVSSSGSTVFIEPIAIFELNNTLSNLKIEESKEIEKILSELSKLFYPYAEEIKEDIECIAELDFIFAKAKYAKSIKGITPIVNDKKYIALINAKHPLLDLNTAVPISVELGNNFNTLVITGPNTGGKTVTLKTIGLLLTMACSGLNIPAEEKTSIFVFDKIFADIGDDQSIVDSLSTFSAHMKNIVDIVNCATTKSLILLDELGSGTDPIEGAALAISILENFKEKDIITVATTHYQELKKYALANEKIENASVEFDIETLSPTYHLLIGVPGKSNAFEISKKLGLKEKIIESAKNNLKTDEKQFEEILKNIYDNQVKIEEKKENISKELEKIQKLKRQLEKDNSDLEKEEKRIIEEAKTKARKMLLDTKDEVNEIITNINKKEKTNSQLNNIRNELNKNIDNLKIEKEDKIAKNVIQREKIKKGLKVFVTNLEKEGTVISNISKSDEVQVQIGSMKMSINIKYLEEISAKKEGNNKNSTASYSTINKTQNAKTEINVIGYNIEEAIFVIDKFLDDSALARLQTVRIVHGKGTGKLREGVHKFLRKNTHVKNFRMGTFGEGEMGVTVVELK